MRFLDTPTLAACAVLAATTLADEATVANPPKDDPAIAALVHEQDVPVLAGPRTPRTIPVVRARGEPDVGSARRRVGSTGVEGYGRCWGIIRAPLAGENRVAPRSSQRSLDSASHATGGNAFSPEPPLRLAIVRCPSPGERPLGLEVSLPDRDRARLEVIDVAGRRAFARDLDGFASGVHRVSLEEASLASGVYWARLAQRGRQSVAKVVIVQ